MRLRGATSIAAFFVSVVVAGCGGTDADKALERAREKTLSAPRMIVTHSGGRDLYLSPKLTVIKNRGRVLAWTATDEEFTLRRSEDCYERHTQFNRDDVPDQREAVAPPDVRGVEWEEHNGRRVLSARESHTDYADTEYEWHLDRVGRLASARVRSAQFGLVPAGRWRTSKYRYPTAEQFPRMAGPAPKPRC